MWENFLPEGPFGEPPSDSHRGEAVRLLHVREGIQAQGAYRTPYAHPYGRAALLLQPLWQAFLAKGESFRERMTNSTELYHVIYMYSYE